MASPRQEQDGWHTIEQSVKVKHTKSDLCNMTRQLCNKNNNRSTLYKVFIRANLQLVGLYVHTQLPTVGRVVHPETVFCIPPLSPVVIWLSNAFLGSPTSLSIVLSALTSTFSSIQLHWSLLFRTILLETLERPVTDHQACCVHSHSLSSLSCWPLWPSGSAFKLVWSCALVFCSDKHGIYVICTRLK